MKRMVRRLINIYLKYYLYFYSHLGYRVFAALLFSVLVGVLDGFGLAMLLPLLQMVDGSNEVDATGMGNLDFIVDFITSAGFTLTIDTVLMTMVVFFSLKGIARFYEIYYRVNLRYFFVKKLRFENIDALTDLSYKSFVLSDSGRIQNTLSGEIGRIVQSFTNYFLSAQQAVLVIVYIALAFVANPEMAALVAVGGSLTILLYTTIYKRSKLFSKQITTSSHGFQGLLIQKVAFFKYLKASAGIQHYADRLKEKAEEIEVVNKRLGFMGAIMEASREPLIMVVVVIIIFTQLNFFGQSLGPIILSLMLLYRALNSLMLLQVQWNTFLSLSGSVDNMTEFMKEINDNKEVYGNGDIGEFTGQIEVNNLSFRYQEKIVLRDVNLRIEKNQTVAFVGESGSGKTTLVNVLAGLMHPNSGSVKVDGKDLSQIDVRSYQKHLGYITQEPVIFSDTIFNNVTFWADRNPETERRFWAALEKASIIDFVRDLPQAEESPLGSNGILVSGGQKQRLSIARELFKEVDILIMDEATSALDSETEKTIQENIDLLKGSYTFLIVAHRLSTVKSADKIVLMRNGKVEEIGSFSDLNSRSKTFRRMVELQEI